MICWTASLYFVLNFSSISGLFYINVQFTNFCRNYPYEIHTIDSFSQADRSDPQIGHVPNWNTVHNLAQVNWRNPGGTEDAISFDNYILDCIQRRDDAAVIHYDSRPEAGYAVPTPEHFLPLLYILGASEGEKPYVFNHECNLGAIAMTSYLFG